MSHETMPSRQMPVLFLSHGGPDVAINDHPASRFYRQLAATFPKPAAIVIMSAHFETDGVCVVFDPQPEMIYDFGRGFPAELFEMRYPAPGSAEFAEKAYDLLEQAGLSPDRIERRGYDHGTWTMMRLIYPEADIPIVQISIDPNRDAEWHYRIGKALSPLRSNNVLLVGSGHITHNLRAAFAEMSGRVSVPEAFSARVDSFTDWFAETVEAGDNAALLRWREDAPYVVDNHPTDEHLMPIFFAAGAGGAQSEGRRIHHSREGGVLTFDVYRFD